MSLPLTRKPAELLHGRQVSFSNGNNPTDFDIQTSSNPQDFERLQREWDELCHRENIESPFLECDWFHAWWKAFGANHQLKLITIRQGGQLQAVLPLMMGRVWVFGIPCRRLGAISNDHSPLFDLAISGASRGIHQAIWEHLLSSRADWDILDLPQLPAHSDTFVLFREYATQEGIRHSIWDQAPGAPWVDTQTSWEEYLQDRSKGFRKALRRKLRGLSKEGDFALETLTDADAIDKALGDGFRIEAAGWKSHEKTAITSAGEALEFYTTLARVQSRKGNLRLHFLILNGRRIAFDYSIVKHKRLYSLKSGLDYRHARQSPGTLLLYLILQKAHDEGLIEVDLLGNTDAFKMQWTHKVRPSQWMLIYSFSKRARLLFTLKIRMLPAIRELVTLD